MRVKIRYDKDSGKSEVILFDKKRRYRGTAKVHPEDRSIASELTGITIADYRARIKREKIKISQALIKQKALWNEIQSLNRYIENRTQVKVVLEERLNAFVEDKSKFQENYKKVLARKSE